MIMKVTLSGVLFLEYSWNIRYKKQYLLYQPIPHLLQLCNSEIVKETSVEDNM